MKKIVLGAMAVLLSSGTAFAAGSGNTSTATGSANAQVVAPIVLTHTSGAALSFGKFTTGAGGTVVVSAAGVGSATGDVGLVPGYVSSADAFSVAGDSSRSFAITTSAGTVSAGSTSLSFTTTPSVASTSLSSSGTATFTVGGALTVPASAPAGTYTGSYNATVTYN